MEDTALQGRLCQVDRRNYRTGGSQSFDMARRARWFGPSLNLRDSQDRQRYRTYAIPRHVNGAGVVRLATVQREILQATGELGFEYKRLRQSARGRHDRADVIEGQAENRKAEGTMAGKTRRRMNDSFALSDSPEEGRLCGPLRRAGWDYLPDFGGGGGFGRTITTGGPPQ